MKLKYFDNAATTKVSKEVLDEIFPYIYEEFGNPSSIYTIGRRAERKIEEARRKIADLINASHQEICFTGCGSESNNMAIKGIAYKNKNKGKHIITSKIEHHSVLNTCKHLEKKGFKVTYINVSNEGIIDLNQLEKSISDETILISIMSANNELGTLQPIKEIGEIARKKGVIFHTDAVQAFGQIEIDVENSNIDLMSMSGHKVKCPKGIGALYIRKNIELDTYLDGGHQEDGKRAGTENVTGIIGFGKAAEIAKRNMKTDAKILKNIRDYYISKVKGNIANFTINGSIEKRLPGNANISFIGIDAQELLLYLDTKNICASSGSACNSGEDGPSHVLTAIGLEEKLANSALRTTFGIDNTYSDIDFLVGEISKFINTHEKP